MNAAGSMIICGLVGPLAALAFVSSVVSSFTYSTESAVITSCRGLDTRGATCIAQYTQDRQSRRATIDVSGIDQPSINDHVKVSVGQSGEDVYLAGKDATFNIIAAAVLVLLCIFAFTASAAEVRKASRDIPNPTEPSPPR